MTRAACEPAETKRSTFMERAELRRGRRRGRKQDNQRAKSSTEKLPIDSRIVKDVARRDQAAADQGEAHTIARPDTGFSCKVFRFRQVRLVPREFTFARPYLMVPSAIIDSK